MRPFHVFLYLLAALNLLALLCWLSSLGYRVVLFHDQGWRRLLARVPRPAVGALISAWSSRLQALWPPGLRRHEAAPAPEQLPDAMESWIGEVDEAEAPQQAAPASGSEAWWRSWGRLRRVVAAGGRIRPPAADRLPGGLKKMGIPAPAASGTRLDSELGSEDRYA